MATMTMEKEKRYARAGFTLMEILIAVMILGLLSALVGPAVMNIYKGQQKKAAKSSLEGFKKGVSMYQLHVQALPTTLKDLIKKPKEERASKKWDGPYVGDDLTEVPEDPWGTKYVYKVTPGAKHPYELYSYGPNGKGSPKDEWIDVWND
ncbi:MAG TPA: type II secretion system major pseudopilin GspG [Candidatus Babeliales bacterium]|jgi:general secretion pathway protein G|nr:type II secretion system major pseudopilin GspG [Candidatus Babeliales bacterium]